MTNIFSIFTIADIFSILSDIVVIVGGYIFITRFKREANDRMTKIEEKISKIESDKEIS